MTTCDVLIVDYGMGNLGSVRRAFEECGARVEVSADPARLAGAARAVIPGVGAFGDGMRHLEEKGWPEALAAAIKGQKPILGICLGMQLLADRGFEGGEHRGLGFIPGEVVKLAPASASERIPHVGWNEIYPRGDCPLFEGVAPGTDVYFVHSYRFIPGDAAMIAAVTPYCGEFASAVASGKVFGVQFHPEKSAKPGFQILRNFLRA